MNILTHHYIMTDDVSYFTDIKNSENHNLDTISWYWRNAGKVCTSSQHMPAKITWTLWLSAIFETVLYKITASDSITKKMTVWLDMTL